MPSANTFNLYLNNSSDIHENFNSYTELEEYVEQHVQKGVLCTYIEKDVGGNAIAGHQWLAK